MTYKGTTYESLIDIKRLIIVEEAKLKTLKVKQKYLRYTGDPEKNSVAIEINLQENFLKELNEVLDDLLNTMELLCAGMNDIETQIFIRMYIAGKDTNEIEEELSISRATLYRYKESIDKKLDETMFGQQFKMALEI